VVFDVSTQSLFNRTFEKVQLKARILNSIFFHSLSSYSAKQPTIILTAESNNLELQMILESLRNNRPLKALW